MGHDETSFWSSENTAQPERDRYVDESTQSATPDVAAATSSFVTTRNALARKRGDRITEKFFYRPRWEMDARQSGYRDGNPADRKIPEGFSWRGLPAGRHRAARQDRRLRCAPHRQPIGADKRPRAFVALERQQRVSPAGGESDRMAALAVENGRGSSAPSPPARQPRSQGIRLDEGHVGRARASQPAAIRRAATPAAGCGPCRTSFRAEHHIGQPFRRQQSAEDAAPAAIPRCSTRAGVAQSARRHGNDRRAVNQPPVKRLVAAGVSPPASNGGRRFR